MKIVREGTARQYPEMCRQGCGRPDHGTVACDPLAPILVFDEEELQECCSCAVYKNAIRTAIEMLMKDGNAEAAANYLMGVLDTPWEHTAKSD